MHLRDRQDITAKQIELAHWNENTDALSNLRIRAEHLRQAVERQAYPNTENWTMATPTNDLRQFVRMDQRVSGDDSDLRHLDPKPAIVVLKAKGRAASDGSGFVVTL